MSGNRSDYTAAVIQFESELCQTQVAVTNRDMSFQNLMNVYLPNGAVRPCHDSLKLRQ